ncbi:MAG TPA: NYN domain-containing protein [Solirubrobacterales bacterium]|nr:NYN domain-containing protein [Solirubrobacterales bacterium]
MRTIVYIDALNLYYRSLRDTPYRWLDPVALADTILPRDEVIAVKYFTAQIKALPHDPAAPTRQQIYLRALRTIRRIDLQDGFFMRRKKFAALAIGKIGEDFGRKELLRARLLRLALKGSGLLVMKSDPIPRIQVWKTEEKGSDVNLASHLLIDGRDGIYEQAAVISNDSDLAWPIQYVRDALGLPVVVLNPSRHRNKRLSPPGTPYRAIKEPDLAASQLPLVVADAKGKIHRPAEWAQPKKH